MENRQSTILAHLTVSAPVVRFLHSYYAFEFISMVAVPQNRNPLSTVLLAIKLGCFYHGFDRTNVHQQLLCILYLVHLTVVRTSGSVSVQSNVLKHISAVGAS